MPEQWTTAPSGSRPGKSIDVKFDLETAVDLADYFVSRNKLSNAVTTLHAVVNLDPYNDAVRRKFADLLFRSKQEQFAVGTVERSRFLLNVMGFDYLSHEIERTYFENLEVLLRSRPPSAARGSLVLGLGPGRCGSTSLTEMLQRTSVCCATHENPPLVHWTPKDEQVAFHRKRFEILLQYFPVVFDAAHWWLNALGGLKQSFPEVKLVALIRDPDDCAASFLKVKGVGPGSINHWTEHGGLYWKPAVWDRLYPSYDVNDFASAPTDFQNEEAVHKLQLELVRKFVSDYNAAIMALNGSMEDRLLVVPTEDLSGQQVQDRIHDFIGVEGAFFEEVRNQGTTDDGMIQALRF